jgi:hypothetical protein
MLDETEVQNRGAFLRRMGKTLAVGLGVALIPVANANAELVRCCPDWDMCPPCVQGKTPHWCQQSSCCACLLTDYCRSFQLPPC